MAKQSKNQPDTPNGHAPEVNGDFEDWENATAVIWQPVVGEPLLGVYDGSVPFVEGTLDTEANKHYVVTKDNIRYSFVGGQVLDKAILDAGIKAKDHIRITFLGQVDLKKAGHRANTWDIKFKRATPVK